MMRISTTSHLPRLLLLTDIVLRRLPARWMAFIDVDEFIDPAPGLPVHSAEGVKSSNGAFTEFNATNMAAREM